MTKKFRIWGLVQDRLSPGFALHANFVFRGGGNSSKGADSDSSAVGQERKFGISNGMYVVWEEDNGNVPEFAHFVL